MELGVVAGKKNASRYRGVGISLRAYSNNHQCSFTLDALQTHIPIFYEEKV